MSWISYGDGACTVEPQEREQIVGHIHTYVCATRAKFNCNFMLDDKINFHKIENYTYLNTKQQNIRSFSSTWWWLQFETQKKKKIGIKIQQKYDIYWFSVFYWRHWNFLYCVLYFSLKFCFWSKQTYTYIYTSSLSPRRNESIINSSFFYLYEIDLSLYMAGMYVCILPLYARWFWCMYHMWCVYIYCTTYDLFVRPWRWTCKSRYIKMLILKTKL